MADYWKNIVILLLGIKRLLFCHFVNCFLKGTCKQSSLISAWINQTFMHRICNWYLCIILPTLFHTAAIHIVFLNGILKFVLKYWKVDMWQIFANWSHFQNL